MPGKVGRGIGFGKVILFGEHFVVYGLPAIASAIDRTVEVEVTENEKGIIFEDRNFDRTVSYEEEKDHILSRTFGKVIEYFGVSNIKVRISGNVIPMAGMGYSAALSVALVRALNDFSGKDISDDEVNRLAYECEKVSHGNPSGIDNTCATFGTMIFFKKDMAGGKNTIEPIETNGTLRLVLCNSGKKGNTMELISGVRERKEKEPEKYEKIFRRAEGIVSEAMEKIESGDVSGIGSLMNENHMLLKEIGVSTPELEEMRDIAMDNGALGAKITGAGGGGFIVALAENEEAQNKISKAVEDKGYKTLKTMIGSIFE